MRSWTLGIGAEGATVRGAGVIHSLTRMAVPPVDWALVLIERSPRTPERVGAQDLHIIGALECGRLAYGAVAHASLHLRDRLVLVRFHPLDRRGADRRQVLDPELEKRRGHHGHASPGHHLLAHTGPPL